MSVSACGFSFKKRCFIGKRRVLESGDFRVVAGRHCRRKNLSFVGGLQTLHSV